MFRPVLQIGIVLLVLVGCQQFLQSTILLESSTASDSATISSEQIVGRVVRVIDGDTVSVLDANNTQHRIRLSQIDAPETKQAFSRVAKEALSDLIANQEVRVKVDGTDRYQRVLGEIFIADQNINLYMVRNGFAWAYTDYVTDQRYFDAQAQAKKEQLGLWVDTHPIAPWDFRRQQREQRKQKGSHD